MHHIFSVRLLQWTKRRPAILRFILFAGLLFVTSASASESATVADLILTRGRIYTGNPARQWVEAIAVANGRIVAVGAIPEVEKYAGVTTRRVDLKGQFAMAALVDDHVHPVMGGLKFLYECNFPFSSTPDDVVRAVGRCAAIAPAGAWIRGGQWDSGFFDTYHIEEPRRFLDAVSGNHPVMLVDDSEHNGWVNSIALRMAGIDERTPDPPGGRIVRNSGGSPNGVLLESAFRVLFKKVLPAWTPEQHMAAVREAVRGANSVGITALKDAGAYEEYLTAYDAVDAAGDLTLHVAACLRTPSGSRSDGLDYASLEQRRDRYRSRHVSTDFVKIFLDGVPTAARTAAMLAPYVLASDHNADNRGELLVSESLLSRDLVELDRRGFTVKIHAAGDRAVRVGLDAVEAARRANGDSGRHHELAHSGYIDPVDIPRFASLDVVPDFSPVIWYPAPIITSILHAVGERGGQYWPTRSLLASGALVAGGTDWPAAVADENPWEGIAALVTRRDPQGRTTDALWPEESVPLEDAIRIYTLNSARALRLEDIAGSIEVGKSADLIVLDRDLFKVKPEEVATVKVRMTWFEGQLVYGSDQ